MLASLILACTASDDTAPPGAEQRKSAFRPPPTPTAEELYLPGRNLVHGESREGACPESMVDIAGAFCIDRYESILVDPQGRRFSPHYHPTRELAVDARNRWTRLAKSMGSALAQAAPLPPLPEWQESENAEATASSRANALPNGYVSGDLAAQVCQRAGKRLCTDDEWTRACRGEDDRNYPYGDEYVWGQCNVARLSHPAHVLHADASRGHLDPRLGTVEDEHGPLLAKTGAYGECGSRWGNDAVFDMVGNLDEWVQSETGRFRGGFFSRDTQAGCAAKVQAHPNWYYDYSLGVRCCRDPLP